MTACCAMASGDGPVLRTGLFRTTTRTPWTVWRRSAMAFCFYNVQSSMIRRHSSTCLNRRRMSDWRTAGCSDKRVPCPKLATALTGRPSDERSKTGAGASIVNTQPSSMASPPITTAPYALMFIGATNNEGYGRGLDEQRWNAFRHIVWRRNQVRDISGRQPATASVDHRRIPILRTCGNFARRSTSGGTDLWRFPADVLTMATAARRSILGPMKASIVTNGLRRR